jgi:group I intron endonuclease
LKTKIISENKNKSGVYRWVNNINGKTYIGSAVDLSNRIIRYYNYKNISDWRKNMLIHKALLKFGYSNFTV